MATAKNPPLSPVSAKTTVRALFPRIEPSIAPEVQRHFQLIYRTLNNHALAIGNTTTAATTATTTTSTGSGGATTTSGVSSFNGRTGIVNFFPSLGFVSNLTSVTAYTVVSTDSGKVIILNAGSAIAVTLDSTLVTPWFATFFNQGTGAATLTPTSGTVNGSASYVIPGGNFALVYTDGANWYAAQAGPVLNQPTVYWAYRSISSNYAIQTSDYQIECNGGSFTVTLPTAVGIQGQVFSIKNDAGGGAVTVATTGGQTIDGSATDNVTPGSNLTVMSNGANWIII